MSRRWPSRGRIVVNTLLAAERASIEHLIVVAGHAVYVGHGGEPPDRDSGWLLQSHQRGEPPFYIEHIRAGAALAAADERSLLVFSGGQTRWDAGPRSEAESYWTLAEHFDWWSAPELRARAVTEEFARDSFENLLFGICRFREATGRYPRTVGVVSWAFKEARFQFHRETLRFPASRFRFHGVNQPADLPAAQRGEHDAVAAFRADPFATGGELGAKRADRNPFDRRPPYAVSCPEVAGLLQHRGPHAYEGALPWL
jgi:hypothetical protein